MKLFEEYKLYEEMWDNIGRNKTATTRKPVREAVTAEYKSIAEAQAAKYKIIYSDRHTEIVDEDTMNQLVDELESFTRDDISQIRRISSTGKLGNAIWTEEEGLL